MNTSYKIQCWGASGGDHTTSGRGGYVLGNINIGKSANLYIYVGGIGLVGSGKNNTVGGWNGGGRLHNELHETNCYSGGGATDIRLNDGNWDNFNSLKSRIMVAGGGGGGIVYGKGWSYGGNAGGLIASTIYSRISDNLYMSGATQTFGSIALKSINTSPIGADGQFGKGGTGGRWLAGGGGAGYYGGAGGTNDPEYEGKSAGEIAGGGGSSFISGYTGCNAIAESSTEDSIIHTGQPNHYSGKVFINPVMIDGGSIMPKPKGGTETGHTGNGYCIISWISPSL